MKFEDLEFATIIGIIDYNDVVDSRCLSLDDDTSLRFHTTHWPVHNQKRWRWEFDTGVKASVLGDRFTPEDRQRVIDHLRKRYNLRFFENGRTDWEWFQKKIKQEKKK